MSHRTTGATPREDVRSLPASPVEGQRGACAARLYEARARVRLGGVWAKGPIVVRAIKEQERYNGSETVPGDALGEFVTSRRREFVLAGSPRETS